MSESWSSLFKPENVVELMLKLREEKSLNKKVYGGMTPLCLAISSKNEDAIDLVLSSGLDIGINVTDLGGHTALTRACMNGYLDVVKRLVDLGADINHRTRNDMTPIMHAIQNGHADIALYLAEQGCDLMIVTPLGLVLYNAAKLAEDKGLYKLAETLRHMQKSQDQASHIQIL